MKNVFRSISGWIRKTSKAAGESMIVKAHDMVTHYDRVMREGNYQPNPDSLLERIFSSNRSSRLDNASDVVGAMSRSASKEVFKKIGISSVIGLLSFGYAFSAGIIFVSIAVGYMVREYKKADRLRHKEIEEINLAGQTVRGMRKDLFRLRVAQEQIANISKTMRPGSALTASETMDEILKSVAAERERTSVTDTGRYDTDARFYDFSEPVLKLINYPDDMPQRVTQSDLKHQWDVNKSKSKEPAAPTPTPIAAIDNKPQAGQHLH